MGFGLGGIIGGIGAALNPVGLIANVGAGLLGGGLDFASAQQAANAQRDVNSENTNLAREQMAFQERMSSTAFQRAHADMIKAGINPNLAAGAQSSTPSGAMPTMSPIPPTIGALATGAKDAINIIQGLRESNSRITKNTADTDLSNSGSFLNDQKNRLLTDQVRSQQQMNEMLEYELNVLRQHPDLYSVMKLLNDRGLGVSSAANVGKILSLFAE